MTADRIRRPVVMAAGANSNPAGNPDVRELAYEVTPPAGLTPPVCNGDGTHSWDESELRVLRPAASHRVAVWTCMACATSWRLAPEAAAR